MGTIPHVPLCSGGLGDTLKVSGRESLFLSCYYCKNFCNSIPADFNPLIVKSFFKLQFPFLSKLTCARIFLTSKILRLNQENVYYSNTKIMISIITSLQVCNLSCLALQTGTSVQCSDTKTVTENWVSKENFFVLILTTA